MNVCKNCQSQISCGCQIRRASDGTDCCSRCLEEVESKIKTVVLPQQDIQHTKPSSTNPTNVTVTYTQNLSDS